MKKIILLCSLALIAFSACEPISKDVKMGGVLTADQLVVSAENVTPGSNSIVLYNRTPGVTGSWSDASGVVGVGDVIPLIRAAMGENVFTFTAFCDGGIVVSKPVTVTITVIDVIPDSWFLFAGSLGAEGKTWVWDTAAAGGNVWGAGGYGWSMVPNWGAVGVGATSNGHFVDPDAKMIFDLNGGANFTKIDADGTMKGSWGFDDTKAIPGYSIGQLTISGAMIPCGYDYYGGGTIPQTFDVIKNSDNNIILNYAAPGAVFQDPNWATTSAMWCFKAE